VVTLRFAHFVFIAQRVAAALTYGTSFFGTAKIFLPVADDLEEYHSAQYCKRK